MMLTNDDETIDGTSINETLSMYSPQVQKAIDEVCTICYDL